MVSRFRVLTTPRFDRLAGKLRNQHKSFIGPLMTAIAVLEHDPTNANRQPWIKKLRPMGRNKAEYRLRIRRFRFLYDVDADRKTVILNWCGRRSEGTYR